MIFKILLFQKNFFLSSTNSTDTTKNDCYQWFWEWTQGFIVGEDYGPRAVLEAEEHPGGLTLRSIHTIIQQQKDSACHKQL